MDTQQSSDTRRPETSHPSNIAHLDRLFNYSDVPPRLGIEPGNRIPLTSFAAFTVGGTIGYSHGSKIASYRFRAENAHRLPTTSSAWFQYHKTKNYTSVVGGVKEGFKMGFRLARHDVYTAARTAKFGLKFSLAYGLMQDALGTMKGRRPAYVDFVLGNRRQKTE
ncbi:hypothetical protein FE257_012604 [Aspergillus nanangensis]|uniref:Uncharacterized protein n=1 Tax=Aspergillus nanangensis TaxID=2582783 RepID=A0AAD4GPX9_ASPNN|nr:hypothetical protein FE257_012604 [Aspergillus nanangensis]